VKVSALKISKHQKYTAAFKHRDTGFGSRKTFAVRIPVLSELEHHLVTVKK